ncbi:LCP family protein [Halalkalibacter okhensis]|uniref:Regulatory protein MsrR n=1 Tax=Halalkalibacter okhensis TaxID=333138 RepID=A0A0B0IGM2_9BACI|nr:LCP family protein [Halalkalibacter okhensis]KHF38801.1 transcriptional regulator [Halalkalibacter okhensis]
MSTRKSLKEIRKRRRYRNLVIISSLTFLLLIGAVSTYIFTQYEAGKAETQQEIVKPTSNKPKDFQNEGTNTIIKAKEPENNEPINVLLVGMDTSKDEIARTDTIMIAQYNPTNGDTKIASIMRDSYVEIPGRSKNKINASFAFGGVELLQQTLEHNFNLNIHYYALANFDGFIKLVDTIAPNGIDVTIERQMIDPNNAISFTPGAQKLDGEETLKYVRFRKDYENDFGRVKRQQEIVQHLKDELFSLSGVTKIPKLIGVLEPHIDTNMRTAKMLSLGRDVVLNPIDTIETIRIPIDNSFTDASYQHAGAVLDIDIEANREALLTFFAKTDQDEPHLN